MTNEEYEKIKSELAATLIRFLQAGEAIGKTQAELTGEFMATFGDAARVYMEDKQAVEA